MVCALNLNHGFTQNQNYTVKYQQILNLMPNAKPDSIGLEVTLLHRNNESFYVFNRIESDSVDMDKVIIVKQKVDALTTRRIAKDRTGVGVYKNFDESKLIVREIVAKKGYLITELLPKFDWHIESNKKMIGGFECQKATVTHKGRKYDAWFTTEIPSTDGPWKFHGLPGLILEVRDSERKVEFLFVSIHFNKNIDFIKPIKGIPISSEQELKVLKRKIDEDLIRKLQSDIPKGDKMDVTINQPELIEKNE